MSSACFMGSGLAIRRVGPSLVDPTLSVFGVLEQSHVDPHIPNLSFCERG